MKKIKQLPNNDAASRIEKTAWTFIKTVIGAVPKPFLILDPKSRVIVANKVFYQTFRVRPKETEDRLIYNLGRKQWNIPKLKELLEKILSQKTYFENFKVEHNFPKIGKKIMLLSGRQVYEQIGAPKTILTPIILLVMEDITEQEALKNKIISIEKLTALGKLAALLVHELRNSLSAIRNSTYSLKMFNFQNKHIKKTLDVLEKEGDQMDKIINDILGFAFGFVRKQRLNKTKQNIIKAIKQSLVEIIIPRNIKIHLKLGAIPMIFAEEIHLKQLFFNIIKNAIEAMPRGGLLTIATKKKNNYIAVSIRDTGSGIKKNDLGKIFEPMFSTKKQGSGLGLTACQRIIKLYNGKIGVKSKFRKGTEFIIVIPIKKPGKLISETTNQNFKKYHFN